MRAIITVTGKDTMGIIAKVSAECLKYKINILDITQSVLSGYFTMSMLADISEIATDFHEFVDIMTELGNKNGLKIYTMHEDIFNSMHRM